MGMWYYLAVYGNSNRIGDDDGMLGTVLFYIMSGYSTEEKLNEVIGFATDKELKGSSESYVVDAIELGQRRVDWRGRHERPLAEWLEKNGAR